MKRITKIRRSVKAISPIISVLLMIAIAVSAALVAFAWVSGYMDFTTTNIGKSIQIQSVSNNPPAVYVQNVGDSNVTLKSCYVNGNLDGLASASIDGIILQKSKTQSITEFTFASDFNEKNIDIKIVTAGGVSTEIADTFSSSKTTYTIALETIGAGGGSIAKTPDQENYNLGDEVQITANPNQGWVFSGWTGDITSTNNPETIIISMDTTVQATFTQLVEVSLLSEAFENWNSWDQTSSQWYLSPDQDHSGRFSAKSTDGHEGDLICDQLNTQNSEAVTVDFWYRLANGVDGGDFRVYFYDGSNWDQIVDLGSQSEGSWRHYTYTTTDTQYMKSNFRVRFDSNLGGSETIWLDDVTITTESVP